MDTNRNSDNDILIGAASVGLALTGIGGLLAGLMAVCNGSNEGWATGSSFLAAGVCGIAAAVSFGLLLNALLRK